MPPMVDQMFRYVLQSLWDYIVPHTGWKGSLPTSMHKCALSVLPCTPIPRYEEPNFQLTFRNDVTNLTGTVQFLDI
jgi:hypothetical protein